MEDNKIHEGFMFSATADDVVKLVSASSKGKYTISRKVNMEKYMTEKESEEFNKYFKKCCDISRSAYIKWVEELVKNKETESEEKL